MNLIERTLENLQRRRNKILEGKINSIPSPFVRFSNEFIGIEQGKYYVITSGTKAGKTQFTSFTFLYTPLLYAYNNPDKIRVKFFYYSLEETPEDVTERFMSYLLNKLSEGDIRISPTELRSTKNEKPVSQDILDLLKTEEFNNILSFYEQCVEFPTSRNPTGVYREVRKYMEEHGIVHKKKKIIKDEFGKNIEIEGFDYYEPNDADEYVFVIWDHASLTQPENNMSLKQSIDKLSEYFVILRNRFGVSPILIQQQAFETEGLEAFKLNKVRPSVQGLGDSKYSGRDCNVLLGLFSPFKHELPEYQGYDITKLRNNVRFLEVILNRGGNVGGLIGLFFDGATCNWAELPLPKDTKEMNKLYEYLDFIRGKVKTSFSFLIYTIKKLIK